MKILVTGTAGFIGFHVARILLQKGYEVVGVDSINDYYDQELKYARLKQLGIDKSDIKEEERVGSSLYPKHSFMKLTIENSVALYALFEQETFDAVCHLAAQAGVRYSIENPRAYIDSNVIGFLNILEACRHYNVRNLSFASSSSVYGLNQAQPFQTFHHADHPISLYAATKKSNEMMAHTYAHLYGIQATGLRFFTVYGPWGRPDMAPMLFADAIFHNRAIKVFNYGKMSRDFTYIDDIAEGVIKVIENPAKSSIAFNPLDPNPSCSSAPYRLYNIGNNAPVDLMEFIKTLENAIGKEAQKKYLPMQAGDVTSTYADTTDLIEDLSYSPNTPLSKGIEEFVVWYRDFYSL